MRISLLFPSKLFFGALLLLLFTPNSIKATHVQGGNLTYRCLGGNQYEITLALYRDCAGANAPTSVSIKRKSVLCGINTTFTLNKIAGTGIEVSPICPGSTSKCSNGSLPGVQEYIYRGIVTLPSCSDWILSYSISARNAAITTIQTPSSMSMYIEATLNNLNFPCNSSPTFTNRPVPYICVGQLYCFNNGSNDIDGDSLSYTLITPRHSATTNVTYIGGYSANQPLASSPAATFNPATGDMCVTPTMLQVTVLAMLVKEWRNGVLVGSVMRDIQIQTITCSNNNPYLNGINNTGVYTMNTCAGSPLTFNIPSFDADISQNVTLSWNSGISGATFNAGTGTRPTGVFSWTPTLADVSSIPYCFTITVKDNACPFIGSQTYSFCITVGGFTTTTSTVNAVCTASNGSASVNVTGGLAPLVYNWLPAGSAGSIPTASGLAAASYTCTVTDAVGCSKTLPITVSSSPGGTATIGSFSNITCNGANNGTATVTMNGSATPPFTYVWVPSSAGTAVTANNLGPGTYTVNVTDANGCIASASQTISEPTVLTVSQTFINVGCYGGITGTATATASGGTGPYTYLWMPGALNTASIGSLPIGSYTVTVTDINGCTTSGTVTIVQPPELSITASTTPANCGQTNGSATVTGSGGFPPYTWSWSNGQTNAAATGLASGTYTVTISDLNLCTASAPITVGNISGPTAQITSFSNVICNGENNGNATVGVTGGSPPFSYLWSNGQTTPTANNMPAGIYSVSATDATGCIASTSIAITQPATLTLNAVSTDPVCFGNTNGTATASAVGGTTPYSYVWTINGNPTTPVVTGLGSGIYSVTVADANGCVKNTSVTLTNPPTLSTSISKTNASCNNLCDGTATATINNGTPPYICLWNNPSAQTGPTATGLCAGSYTVTVSDAHGCPSQGVITISEPPPLIGTISSVGNLNCYGVCTGFAQTTATGGTAPYSYTWLPDSSASATASNLCAGTYTCTVTDSKGCIDTTVATITQPDQLIAVISGTDINCYGSCDGTGNIAFSGGTAPYTALWTPGMQTIFNPNNLCPGTNIGKVTDAKGCLVTDSINLIQSYTPIIVSTSITSSNCGQPNGGACASVSGGLPPYTYIWSDSSVTQSACVNAILAGSYTVEVTDSNGCMVSSVANINDILSPAVSITSHTDLLCYGDSNGTATITISGGVGPYNQFWIPGGQTTTNPSDLAGGVNTVKITDAAGCIASASVTIIEPPPVNHAISGLTNISCYSVCDGTATVAAAGGTGSLSFLWDDPASQTTTTATGLCAGNRTVLITDSNGCTALDSATIISEPNSLAISGSSVTNITCFGDNDGSIVPVVSGGTPYYTFTWSPTGGSDPVANALGPGIYTLTVADQNGCTVNQTWSITQPPLLTDTSAFISSHCWHADGTALITASGGTVPYTYQWNDSALQTTPTAVDLYSGSYIVTIIDSNGCTISQNYLINDIPGPIISTIASTPVLCNGDSTGTATVYLTPGAGTAPFVYNWNPGNQIDSLTTGLAQGSYSITVTDAAGCSVTIVVIVSEPPVLQLFTSINDTLCFGDTSQVYTTASGGTPTYSYTWIDTSGNGFTGPGPFMVTPTSTTIYTASVTDNNGCAAGPSDMLVYIKPPLIIQASDTTICGGDSATIYVTVDSASVGPFIYLWDNGDTTLSQVVTPPSDSMESNYIVTVSNGCSSPVSDTSNITINPAPVGSFQASPNTGCEPLTVVFNAVSNSGNSYSWDFGNSSVSSENPATITYADSGLFDVSLTITGPSGCTSVIDSLSYITVYPKPTANFGTESTLSPLISFNDLSTPTITNWLWDFGDSTTINDASNDQNPAYQYQEAGIYTVTLIVTNQFGCMDTTLQQLEISENYEFYAPGCFTPDGNAMNDVFIPKGIAFDVNTFKMMIFDRWGSLIYFTDDFQKGWDGRANHGTEIAQIGVYVWKVELVDNANIKHKYIGRVTLIKN